MPLRGRAGWAGVVVGGGIWVQQAHTTGGGGPRASSGLWTFVHAEPRTPQFFGTSRDHGRGAWPPPRPHRPPLDKFARPTHARGPPRAALRQL